MNPMFATQLEAYVLSGFSPDILNKMLPQSFEYQYLKSLHLLNTSGSKLSNDDKQFISKFISKFKRRKECQSIDIRTRLIVYESVKTNEEKSKILQAIMKEYLKLNFKNITPIQAISSGSDKKESSVTEIFPSILDLSKCYNLNDLVQKLYENEETNFRKLPKRVLLTLDYTKLDNDLFCEICNFLVSDICFIENDTFYQKMAEGLESESFDLYSADYKNMTLDQLDKISKKVPKIKEKILFQVSYFNKKFWKENTPEYQSSLSVSEKRSCLMSMYEYSKTLPPSMNYMKTYLLFDLLQLGIKSNLYDKNLFIEYLKAPFIKEYELNINSNPFSSEWNNELKNVQVQSGSRFDNRDQYREFLRAYLLYFFNSGLTIKDFQDYIRNNILVELWKESQFCTGKKVEISNYDASWFEQLAQKTSLKILSTTKEIFDLEENIEIHVELKNIKNLIVKIFKINALNYYKKNLAPISTSIQLEGLSPTEEIVYEYPQQQHIVHHEVLTFASLKAQKGFFILELIGNGISARAIVKKGNLYLISTLSPAGHLCYIMDQNRKICENPSTEIWIGNEQFKSGEGGAIQIPYASNLINTQAILCSDDIYSIYPFTRKSESYSINFSIIHTPEFLIEEKTAQLLIKPTLFCNNKICPLDLLENNKIYLEIIDVDDLKIRQTFNLGKLAQNHDINISFKVIPRIKNIEIKYSAEVQNMTTKVKQNLELNKTIKVNPSCHSTSIASFNLFKKDNKFFVSLTGKNGEPFPNEKIKFKFKVKNTPSIKKELKTNDKGLVEIINFGHLGSISAKYSGLDSKILTTMRWEITPEVYFQLPKKVDLIEGDKFEIPIPKEFSDDLLLKFVSNNETITNCSNQIQRAYTSNYFATISIQNLFPGKYYLISKDHLFKTIKIQVKKGLYWKNKYIITKSSLKERSGFEKPPIIKKVEFKKEKTGNLAYLYLDNFNKNTKIHVLGFQYLKPRMNFSQESNLIQQNQKEDRTIYLPIWHNLFTKDRRIGTEIQYVMERAKQDPCLIPFFEKPKLLLKRTYIRDTTTEQEEIFEGENYENLEEADNNIMEAKKAKSKKKISRRVKEADYFKKDKGMGGEMSSGKSSESDGSVSSQKEDSGEKDESEKSHGSSIYEEAVQSVMLYNYMKTENFFLSNLKVDQQGRLIIECNFDLYNTILLIATDEKGTSQLMINSPGITKSIEYNDLTLRSILDPTKFYCQEYVSNCIYKGENYQIPDILSTKFASIDSLFKAFRNINEIQGIIEKHKNSFEEFVKICRWNKLSLVEKNDYLMTHGSFELYFFIKCKDNEYFESIIRPYLTNKCEKQFMDFYLLDDINNLLKYVEQPDFTNLNFIEKVLLAAAIKNESPLISQEILSHVKNIAEPIHKSIKANIKGRIYDSIISNNLLNQAESDLEALALLELRINEVIKEKIKGGSVRKNDYRRTERAGSGEDDEEHYEDGFGEGGGGGGGGDDHDVGYEDAEEMDYYGEEEEGLPISYNEMNRMRGGLMGKFHSMGNTKEYRETHYYEFDRENCRPSIFWVEYLENILNPNSKEFLSSNFPFAVTSTMDSVFALSVLDLPYQSSEHGLISKGSNALEIKAASNMILFKKEVIESKSDFKDDLIVSQHFFETIEEDKEIPIDEWIIRKTYGCKYAFSNLSSKEININVLIQIPEGSIPVNKSFYVKSISLTLSSLQTNNIVTYFYFPNPGNFKTYPPSVSQDSIVIAKGSSNIISVVKNKTIISEKRFIDIINSESYDLVLNFLKTKNIFNNKYKFKAELLKRYLLDKKFFDSCINIFKSKKCYNKYIWSFSLFHLDESRIIEYLKSNTAFQEKIGFSFSSKLITFKQAQAQIKILEYSPYVNARCHLLKTKNPSFIFNKEFKETYINFIHYLAQKMHFDESDLLSLSYYLILQDRITDALNIFKKLPNEKSESSLCKIQFDYLKAFFDFYTGGPNYQIARKLVNLYINYPVQIWKFMFLEIKDLLEEYDGKESAETTDAPSFVKEKKLKEAKIQAQPTLHSTIKGTDLIIEYQNLKSILIRYYKLDTEVLFTRFPYLNQSTEQLSYVAPNAEQIINLKPNEDTTKIAILNSFQKISSIIEVIGSGLTSYNTYMPCQMKVILIENFGEVKVSDDSNKIVPKAYIKVFAKKKEGSVLFYKDGYTDFRGRFDYLSLSGAKVEEVDKFSILILHPKLGSVIKNCSPPADLSVPSTKEDDSKMFAQEFQNLRSYKLRKAKFSK